MRAGLILLFGGIPAIVLGLLTFVPLLFGLGVLFNEPDIGSLFVVWAVSGFIGSVAMLRVLRGHFNENTTPSLLAGVAAAAPLAIGTFSTSSFPESLFLGYWTVCPILVAAWIIAERRAGSL
jgi:hypothetical protein